jgi:ribosomal protein L32E
LAYDPETKRQSEETWHMPQSWREKKGCMNKARIKTKVIISLYSHGVVHKKFVPPGIIVN